MSMQFAQMSGGLLRFAQIADLVYLIPGLVFAIIVSWNALVSAFLLGLIFDDLQQLRLANTSNDKFLHDALSTGTGFFGIAVASAALHYGIFFCMTMIGEKQADRASTEFFRSILAKEFVYFDAKKELIGSLVAALRNSNDLKSATSLSLAYTLEAISTIISCLIFALVTDPLLTLVTLAGIPLMLVISLLCSRFMRFFLVDNKKWSTTASDIIHWSTKEIKTVKIFQGERTQIAKLSSQLAFLYGTVKKIYFNLYLQEALTKILSLTMYVGGLFYGVYQVQAEKASAGQVMRVLWCCLVASGSFSTVSNQALYMSRGLAAVQKLDDDIDEESVHIAKIKNLIGLYSGQSNGWLTFRKVNFCYPDGMNNLILKDCSMIFTAGRLNYVVGESGSGKSTLANILLKFYDKTSGSIYVDDQTIDKMSRKWLHDNIAVMSQSTYIFDVSIEDNILLGANGREVSAAELDEIYRASGVSKLIPGLNSQNKNGLRGSALDLSGGQKQCVSFARMLLSKAQIMIFDEPTSAVDARTRKILMKTLRKLSKKKTIIIISHDLTDVASSDYVIVLKHGQILEHGPFWELRKSKEGPFLKMLEASKSGIQDIQVKESFSKRGDDIPDHHKSETSADSVGDTAGDFMSIYTQLIKIMPSTATFLLGVFFAALSAGFNPVFSYAFSKLTAFIIPNESSHERIKWLCILIGLTIGDGLTTFGKVLLDIASEQCLQFMRMEAFQNTLSHRTDWIENRFTTKEDGVQLETLLMNDLENTRLIVSQIGGSVSIVITGVGTAVVCLIIGFKLSLAVLSLMPLFGLITWWFSKASAEWEKQYETANSRVQNTMKDVFSGIKTVKVLAIELLFLKKLAKEREARLVQARKRALLEGFGFAASHSFLYLAQGVVLTYGMKLVSINEYQASEVLIIFVMIMYCIISLETIVASVPQIGNGFETARHVFQLITPPPSSAPTEFFPDFSRIDFENVSFRYSDQSPWVLRNINMTIYKGETVSIMGPSGCGKSTIASLIVRLYLAQEGQILFSGKNICLHNLQSIRSKISVCNQMPLAFFNGTITENLCYGIGENLTAVQKVCKTCLIHDHIMSLPLKYETIIGGSSDIENSQLSGGQLQRLGLARALLREPELVILDEATSALDAISTSAIIEVVEELKSRKSMTIIIITHEQNVAGIADRIINLPSCSRF